ncbi:hypothetical protein SEUCBS139899_008771 [Sporothrix eucalyptigena]|uniref:Uncharacterized protein n=1 Tax=Sporothrix eucalyptigena TaxID=1812306 RepID=A0ABP0B8P5_9PEZI
MGATVRRNKDRLYVGLYVRRSAGKMAGGEERYHWALLRGPKFEDEDTLYKKYQAIDTAENAPGGGESSTSSSSSSPTQARATPMSPLSPAVSTAPTASLSTWMYDEQTIPPYDLMLLARVLIGKIRNPMRFEDVVRAVPVPANRNSFTWVQAALEALASDTIGPMGKSSNLAWPAVCSAATEYIDQKATEHRYDGLAPVGQFDFSKPATFDLLLGKEIVP